MYTMALTLKHPVLRYCGIHNFCINTYMRTYKPVYLAHVTYNCLRDDEHVCKKNEI